MIVLLGAEARLFAASRANWLLVLMLAVLAIFGAANGVVRVATVDRAAAASAEADRATWAGKMRAVGEFEAGRKNATDVAGSRMAHRAILSAASARWTEPPRADFGALSASGVRPTPPGLPVGVASRYRSEDPSLDDPTNRLDGAFDLGFVASWLAPLAAILLSFDIFSRDRELRIAPMLSVQGASIGGIIVARCTVRFAALFAAVALPAVVAAAVSESHEPTAALWAVAAWLIGYALLLIFWLGLAAAINARAHTTVGATLALLLSWIIFALLAPALISVALNNVAPAPDRMADVLKLRALETRLTRDRAQVTAAFYAADPARRPVTPGDEYEHYFVGEYYPRQRAFIRDFAPTAAVADQMRLRQTQALRAAALLAPGLALKLLSDDLAGGAPERRVAYLAAVDRFQGQWLEHFDRKLASMRPLTLADYRSAPQFADVAEPLSLRWRRIMILIVTMLVPAILSLIFAGVRLRRASPL